MSIELQVLFPRPPAGVRVEYGRPQVPEDEVDKRLTSARRQAADEQRQQYEAQISDLRAEAVEFHQQLLGQVEDSVQTWARKWEKAIPELIFAGVQAVLSDFQLSDEQLHRWVKGTLAEAGANDKSELEVRLSAKNVARLEAFWEENGISLPQSCSLHAISDYSEAECRVVGRRGIFDASLSERLAQLKRLWNLEK